MSRSHSNLKSLEQELTKLREENEFLRTQLENSQKGNLNI